MITQYHRPKTLDEALKILSKPNILPLGGGTLLSHLISDSVEVVDLQALGLNSIKKSGNNLEIGATATLQQLHEDVNCSHALNSALKLEAPLNLRNAATVAGAIVTCDGRSTFVTALLALDAKLTIINPKSEIIDLGDFLPLRPRGLITAITIPLNVKFAFDDVARTPADKPIVCVALAQWPSGRTRLAVGGYGNSPRLAMDGHEANDEWSSAEYRMDVIATLVNRCLETMNETSNKQD
jgi:CO/xanthine dehydrogenase FAD-binding subunit